MTDESAVLYCYNHPSTETSLRCNNCERPICPKCARLTPTGYRCPECIRGHQRLFETAEWFDYPLAAVVAGLLSFLGSLIAARLGFLIIFVAPIAGVIISEAVRFVIRRRRSRRLTQVTAAAAALGSLVQVAALLLGFGGSALFALLWQGFYAFTVTTTVLYRLGGITIR